MRWINITWLVAVLALVLSIQAAAAVKISPEAEEVIQEALKGSRAVYKLDPAENDVVFARIDDYFARYFTIETRKRDTGKHDSETIRRIEMPTNVPIALSGESKSGISNDKPFNIWYTKAPRTRSIVKELRVPTDVMLSEDEAETLARAFIGNQHFIHESKVDKIGRAITVSRKRRPINPESEKQESFVLLQRVVFERRFDGYPVVNSKQIVEIYPKTGELLAYKSLDWTPVDESSGQIKPCISEKTLREKLETVARDKVDTLIVRGARVVMYQTEDMLLPSLQLDLERDLDGVEAVALSLIVSLADGYEIATERKGISRPIEARK